MSGSLQMSRTVTLTPLRTSFPSKEPSTYNVRQEKKPSFDGLLTQARLTPFITSVGLTGYSAGKFELWTHVRTLLLLRLRKESEQQQEATLEGICRKTTGRRFPLTKTITLHLI